MSNDAVLAQASNVEQLSRTADLITQANREELAERQRKARIVKSAKASTG
jgi:hypothetical protein